MVSKPEVSISQLADKLDMNEIQWLFLWDDAQLSNGTIKYVVPPNRKQAIQFGVGQSDNICIYKIVTKFQRL